MSHGLGDMGADVPAGDSGDRRVEGEIRGVIAGNQSV
jgi:hypothetical protein